MENLSSAIVMGGSVLLFIIAISVAVYTYMSIMNTNDAILTTSEYYDRTAESYEVLDSYEDYIREYSGAEIAMQIISMFENRDYNFNEITVKMGGNQYVFSAPDGGVTAGDSKIGSNNNNIKIGNIAKSNRRFRIYNADYVSGKITYGFTS
ncbi:MAG: hypothetical protein IKI57_00915 [Clostridia bacterium]|nr:hypothetical protein [Clostridia bacterium]